MSRCWWTDQPIDEMIWRNLVIFTLKEANNIFSALVKSWIWKTKTSQADLNRRSLITVWVPNYPKYISAYWPHHENIQESRYVDGYTLLSFTALHVVESDTKLTSQSQQEYLWRPAASLSLRLFSVAIHYKFIMTKNMTACDVSNVTATKVSRCHEWTMRSADLFAKENVARLFLTKVRLAENEFPRIARHIHITSLGLSGLICYAQMFSKPCSQFENSKHHNRPNPRLCFPKPL